MEIFLWVVGGGLLFGAVLLVVNWQVLQPWRTICESLSRLAQKDFRPVILPRAPWMFRQCTRDVRVIAEILQQFDRQIVDEGFSLRAILAGMVEGVLITDRTQRIRLANEALGSLFHLPVSPVNRTVLEVFRKHELQQALEAVLEGSVAQRIELSFETPAEHGYEVRHFEVHVAGLHPKPAARPTAALVVFHEVTRVKNLEAMRREFLANVSHEFRTPLAIINGYVETLLDGAADDPQMVRHSLRTMHKNGQRLTLLIDDLLTISRIEERAKLMEFQTADLREILDRVLEHLDPNIVERGAKIEVDWAEEARFAEVDPLRIEQVYSNLIGNSLRYGDSKKLVVRITAVRTGDDVKVEFADNGPGIPYDDQPHIFERFYRVHKGRSRDAGGTGLGLSIVRSVVQAHGGRVSVQSTPGVGAAFVVILPAVQATVGQPRLL